MPPRLPKYADDEVRVFHPFVEAALRQALTATGEASALEIEHHGRAGDLTPDFIVRRRATRRIVLVLEVKRTPSDVASTRFRNQARSYVTEALPQFERQYYAMTNIEVIDLFKYSDAPSHASVIQQLVTPSPIEVGTLQTGNLTQVFGRFVDGLVSVLTTALSDSGQYLARTDAIRQMLGQRKADTARWHQAMQTTGFEYIRGALGLTDWQEAIAYRAHPNRLAARGRRIDFNELFETPYPETSDDQIWDRLILEEANETGGHRKTGDHLAAMAHEVLTQGHEREGLVTTDTELARLAAALAKLETGELDAGAVVADPAAGIGSLLSATAYEIPRIQRRQLWANDREEKFKEALALRLGLAFPDVITPQNAPLITCRDILTFTRADFSSTKLVLINPPYVRGVDCVAEKAHFARRVRELTGRDAAQAAGQAGLDAVFMELVTALVPEGTVIAAILPSRNIHARGNEGVAFRRFLLETFGLVSLVMYPRTGLFEDVVKGTALFVGKTGETRRAIKVVASILPLEGLSPSEFSAAVERLEGDANEDVTLMYGVRGRSLNRHDLLRTAETGWGSLIGPRRAARAWVDESFAQDFRTLGELDGSRRHGRGNMGASTLHFPSGDLLAGMPPDWVLPHAVIRSNQEHRFVLEATSAVAFYPPDGAFREAGRDNATLRAVIDRYVASADARTPREGRQARRTMTPERAMRSLQREGQTAAPANTLLLCRDIRRHARVFVTTAPTAVSTNFITYEGLDEDAWVAASWFGTVFSQVQQELESIDQEGPRKMEKRQLDLLRFPDPRRLSGRHRQDLRAAFDRTRVARFAAHQTEFMDLYHPALTELDRYWAGYLWGEQAESRCAEALDLLFDLVALRNPTDI